MKPVVLAPLVALALAGGAAAAYWAVVAAAGGTAWLFPGEAHAQQGVLTVTPASGPVGTAVVLEGQGCNNPGQSALISFGIGAEEPGGGTVGSVTLPETDPGTDDSFRTSFAIPSVLGPYQGRGGGATVPGTYTFFSHPPLCVAKFVVTSSGLPATGSAPPSGSADVSALVFAWVGAIGLVVGSTLILSLIIARGGGQGGGD